MRTTIGGGGPRPATGTRPHHRGGRGGISYVGAPILVEEVVYETDLSPNALYKRYRKWYFENHGNSFDGVMPFKEWIKWAKARGVINADGATGDPASMKYEQKISDPVKDATKGINVGKIIAASLVLASIAGIIVALTSSPKSA